MANELYFLDSHNNGWYADISDLLNYSRIATGLDAATIGGALEKKYFKQYYHPNTFKKIVITNCSDKNIVINSAQIDVKEVQFDNLQSFGCVMNNNTTKIIGDYCGRIECWQSYALESIQVGYCEFLACQECNNLKSIFGKYVGLDCHGCPSLTSLPDLTNCTTLKCDNRMLNNIVNIPNSIHVFY